MKLILMIFLIQLVAVTSVLSQTGGNPDNWCREGLFTRESKTFGVGFVKTNRANFYLDDKDRCPAAAICRTKSYVVKGDPIVTSKKFGDFTCGWFTSANGGVKVGWLKTVELDFPLMVHDASDRVWIGEWTYASSSIEFAADNQAGFLKVTGNAFWKGLGDNIHIGELNGRSPHKDGHLEYSDGDSEFDCKAKMQLVMGQFLLVSDNGNCGGANVTFSGIYRKAQTKKPSSK